MQEARTSEEEMEADASDRSHLSSIDTVDGGDYGFRALSQRK